MRRATHCHLYILLRRGSINISSTEQEEESRAERTLSHLRVLTHSEGSLPGLDLPQAALPGTSRTRRACKVGEAGAKVSRGTGANAKPWPPRAPWAPFQAALFCRFL